MAKVVDPDAATAKLPPHLKPLAPPPPFPIADTQPWGPDSQAAKITAAEIASNAANRNAAGANGSYFAYQGEQPLNGPASVADPSKDWASAFFGALGLPDDVMKQVTQTLRDHAQDPTLAQALATQYIRSTGWYAIHYPGALEGIAKGVIADESGYASYLNQVNVLSRQYQGRDISGDEIKGYLGSGYNPGYVANLFQGQAYVAANRNDIQYLGGAFGNGRLNEGQLAAVGNESAGIDTSVGQLQQKVIQKAQQVHDKLFGGSLATPSLSLGANGLSSSSLQGTANRATPDVGA
jgi:hypothetical protein